MSARAHAPAPPRWSSRTMARDPDETHRVATPLELLYDLVFVVAVAQAAAGLHHALAEGHWQSGLLGYAMVFFSIWWGWLQFAWFASAYDADDTLYRLLVMVQMAGALVLAAGIESAFDHGDFHTVVIGYCIIRLSMIAMWTRAALNDPERRGTCVRYAAGLVIVQTGWIARLALDAPLSGIGFAVLVLIELTIPVLAERATQTTWHRHHITERYGLFTIIVLGETVLASTLATQSAFTHGDNRTQVLITAAAALVTLFSMWWLYFARPAHDLLTNLRTGFRWGYGHYFAFASAAATGPGIEILVERTEGLSHLSQVAAAAPLTIAVAVYILSVWTIQIAPRGSSPLIWAYPACAALTIAATFSSQPVVVTALLLAALVAHTVAVNDRESCRAR